MDFTEELRRLGLTGDPDIDEIAVLNLTPAQQAAYQRIKGRMAKANETPSEKKDEEKKETPKKPQDYEGFTYIPPKKKETGDEAEPEPMSDAEIDAMADALSFKA